MTYRSTASTADTHLCLILLHQRLVLSCKPLWLYLDILKPRKIVRWEYDLIDHETMTVSSGAWLTHTGFFMKNINNIIFLLSQKVAMTFNQNGYRNVCGKGLEIWSSVWKCNTTSIRRVGFEALQRKTTPEKTAENSACFNKVHGIHFLLNTIFDSWISGSLLLPFVFLLTPRFILPAADHEKESLFVCIKHEAPKARPHSY